MIHKIIRDSGLKNFEFFYLFVMVIYMGHMTPETRRMMESLSGNPIPFLIPIILTIILINRNKISFRNTHFCIALVISVLWTCCHVLVQDFYSTKELSYYFFLFYNIVIAYIHINVYKNSLFVGYESVMTLICIITVPLWIFGQFGHDLFLSLPKTGFGNHLLYVYNQMTFGGIQTSMGVMRNAGCSWEPGRFSIMVTLALFVNLMKNGIKFKNNGHVFWLLLGLLSTMSTTGYVNAIILYGCFVIKQVRFKNILVFLFAFIPFVIIISQLEFMKDKLTEKADYLVEVERVELHNDWYEKNMGGDEMAFAIDRFPSMYFETENIKHDPILGYGRNNAHSYFYQNYSSAYGITGDLLQIFGMYGIPLVYMVLFKSSRMLIQERGVKRYAMFFLFLSSLVSYPMFGYPIFTAFWMYSFFINSTHKDKLIYENG